MNISIISVLFTEAELTTLVDELFEHPAPDDLTRMMRVLCTIMVSYPDMALADCVAMLFVRGDYQSAAVIYEIYSSLSYKGAKSVS
jgi:hypothetical protein